MNKDIEQQPSPAYLEDELLEQIRSLPPRSVTHRKRREEKELKRRRFRKESDLNDDDYIDVDEQAEEEGEEQEQEDQEEQPRRPRKRSSFLLIQVILFTFLALILTFLLFWYWQEQKNLATQPVSDPFDRLVEQGAFHPVLTPEELEEDQEGPEQGEDGAAGQQKPSDERDSTSGGSPDDDQAGKDEEQKDAPSLEEQDSSVKEQKIIAEHTIQSGETLYRISVKYYGTGEYAEAIAEFNDITDKRKIRSGMVLQIPELP